MKKVFVSGCFNILHPGHLRLLRFAKECGNELIVGVESDHIAGDAALLPENLRLEGIRANSYVDSSFIIDKDIAQVILEIKPDIVVKGKEHENQFNIEAEALKTYGGTLLFTSGESIFSSLDILRREFYQVSTDCIKIPFDFMDRHKIEQIMLVDTVRKFNKLSVCIIGDLIIDEYITCQALGMSQEDPTLVVTPIDKTRFTGGAAIVALHAAAMGAKTDFISIVGNDDVGLYAKAKLELDTPKLNAYLMLDESRPTTLKQRYRSKGKTLLRVSQLHQNSISEKLKLRIYEHIKNNIKKYNLIVLSDFNYGCLPQDLVEKIIELSKQFGIFIAADSQSSSQIGDVSRFKGVDLITPTEHEARISLKNSEDGLVVLAEKLYEKTNVKNIFLKMGEEGLLLHVGDAGEREWVTDRIPALNLSAKDVSGAGDSLLISSAMAMALGATNWEAACLGSMAAAIQVSRVGNIPIYKEELLKELNKTK